jgi:Uma2 family endonuclease
VKRQRAQYLISDIDRFVPDASVDPMPEQVAVFPHSRRWTRAEYDRLVDLGVLQEDERVELLDGVLAVREPQGSDHAAGVRRVVRALRAAFGDGYQIDSQLPIALDDYSEPEPDVVVVPTRSDDYRSGHPERPLLLVEIADSSYRIDHGYKAGLYARAGVAEYWIIDLTNEVLEVQREPERAPDTVLGWRYARVERLPRSATITPLAAPAVVMSVAELVP